MSNKITDKKLDVWKTILVGFGFLATSVAWSVYNANVPLMLNEYVSETRNIGAIMAIDNIFAVIFQPIFGMLSDRTITKIGKRKPFILIGLPICAMFFLFIPRMKSLGLMMIVVILFNFTMSIWRTPIISLMPDLTPEQHRSKANGIINLMGGIGGILAFLVGGIILNITKNNFNVLFSVVSAVMMISWLVILVFIKEPVSATIAVKKAEVVKVSSKDFTKNLIFLLLAIFFWFSAHNTLETFFTIFAVEVHGVKEGTASIILSIFSVVFAIMAVPAGFIGEKRGRRKTIMTGITIQTIIFFSVFFIKSQVYLIIVMVIGGIGWALININSLPMVLEIGGMDKIGTFTGFYYAASQSASVVAPIVFGLINDYIAKDINSMSIFASVSYAMAFICMYQIKGKK